MTPAFLRRRTLAVACLLAACGGSVVPDGDDAARPPRVDGPTCRPPEDPDSPGAPDGFVAVGATGIAVSPNGATWERRPYGTSFVGYRVAASRGRVVAIGSAAVDDRDRNVIAVTTDLHVWRTTTITPADCSLSDVAFLAGRFVVVGASWNSGSCVFTSTDGASWAPLGGAPTAYMFDELVRGSRELVVAGHYRSDLMTPAVHVREGDAFRNLTPGTATRRDEGGFRAAVDLGDRVVLVDGGSEVLAWTDRATFAPAPEGAPAPEVSSWSRVRRAAGRLVLLGTSSDGEALVGVRELDPARAAIAVTLRRAGTRFRGVADDGGRVVVVSDDGAAFRAVGDEPWETVLDPGMPLHDVSATYRAPE